MKQPGERIGRWVVEHRLGVGGFGSVYRCHQHQAERIAAAIKVLELPGSKADRRRFLREAEILHGLDHPNVVRLLGVEADGDLPFLEMELVTGVSLDEKLRSGPLPVDDVLRYASQLASALAFVHARGVRHRDIKPSNVIVRPDGVLKLVDFGVALDEDADRLTRAGTFLGTPEYAPPEWVAGKVDPTLWDAYAFGVLLYELLIGAVPPPFRRDGRGRALEQAMRVMASKEEHPPLDPGPPAPDSLRSIVRGLTEPEPTRRQSSMMRVQQALAGVSWEKPGSTLVPVRPTPQPARDSVVLRVQGAVRRLWVAVGAVTAAAVVTLGVAALAGVGVAAWFVGPGRDSVASAVDEPASATAPPQTAPSPKPPPPTPAPTAAPPPAMARPAAVPPPAEAPRLPSPDPVPAPMELPPVPTLPVAAPEPAPAPPIATQRASTVRMQGDAIRIQLVRGAETRLIGRGEIMEVPAGTWRVNALWTVDGDYKRTLSALNVPESVVMILTCSGSTRTCIPSEGD